MPRIYRRKPGSRACTTTYSQETLSNAMKKCLTGKMRVRKASRQFEISSAKGTMAQNTGKLAKGNAHQRIKKSVPLSPCSTATSIEKL